MNKRLLRILLITGMLIVLSGCRGKDLPADSAREEALNTQAPVPTAEITLAPESAAGKAEDITDIEENDTAQISPTISAADTGSNSDTNIKEAAADEDSTTEAPPVGEETAEALTVKGVYRLDTPEFIDASDISLCKIAKDYVDLSNSGFSEKYTEEELWDNGAFNRLLFTKKAKGKIIADIGIGSPLTNVIDTFGGPQFGTAVKDITESVYSLPLLYGYKTRDFYFAFEINPDTKRVETICFRKRYPMPEKLKDMLIVMARFGAWYDSTDFFDNKEMNPYLSNDKVSLTQWGRGTMTIICDYGFTSTSGMGVNYEIYGDYEGDIPVLPRMTDEYTGEDYDPVTIYDTDYPEEMIYRIYCYLDEQSTALKEGNGITSPDGKLFAYAVDSDLLDLTMSSGLYETAHVVLHSLDGSRPDENIYFGHYSTIIGFIDNRYLVESNMLGLHVYDTVKSENVFWEDTLDGRSDLTIDEKQRTISDSERKVQYTYQLGNDGELTVNRAE